MKRQAVTVVGGGNAAHVITGLLGNELDVRLLVQPHECACFGKSVTVEFEQKQMIKRKWEGSLQSVSQNPSEVIPGSDIIILCLPVRYYRTMLDKIAGSIDKQTPVYVGTVYGQGGFNWMLQEIIEKHNFTNLIGFAIGLIPWICRVKEYGRVGITYGCKEKNVVAMTHPSHFQQLNHNFLSYLCELPFDGKGKFELASNFLSLTLSVDNQIIHPARCYALYQQCGGSWDNLESVPYFYRDFDEESARILKGLDDDYSKVREAIKKKFAPMKFHPMLDYLAAERYSNGTCNTDIRLSFTQSVQLRDIKPPLRRNEKTSRYELDTNHRFFHDEFQFGLCITKWFATKLDLKVANIDAVLEWAQELKKERLIENGTLLLNSPDIAGEFKSGVPSVYGIQTLEAAMG